MVLKNRLNISNAVELARVEEKLSKIKARYRCKLLPS
jgi:hypothetical protein